LGQLRKLRHLDLEENKLDSLPQEIGIKLIIKKKESNKNFSLDYFRV